ncbi:MAG: hypothetical protein ACI959_000791 [Limisphaerales bacterium]|jgi:hypothetical protein
MRSLILLTVILIGSASLFDINAQRAHLSKDYTAAVGLLAGSSIGVTGKYFIAPDFAVEAHFASRRRGLEIAGFGLLHRDIKKDHDFNWFFGGGAHVGFAEYSNSDLGQRTEATLGIDGMLGLEYTFEQLPLNLAVNWKPEFNFTGVTGLDLASAGISIRYVLR